MSGGDSSSISNRDDTDVQRCSDDAELIRLIIAICSDMKTSKNFHHRCKEEIIEVTTTHCHRCRFQIYDAHYRIHYK